ncbi:MAG: B12-binding domain-containing radical SAM protein [Planctomycetes bacterium]|nr:B12-binding domain-containing radical SAM protein [Planctomycetota bacterium]
MKVMLVWSDVTTVDVYRDQLGIIEIAALLREAGHELDLIYCKKPPTREEVHRKVLAFEPDVLGFSVVTGQWPYSLQIAKYAREVTRAPIVFGGRHPNHDTLRVLQNPEIDVVFKGEAEFEFLEYVNALEQKTEWRGINNIAYLKPNGDLHENPLTHLIDDLDVLPIPYREIFPYKEILRKRGGVFSVMAGRGCPYKCTYCAAPTTVEQYKDNGKIFRKLSVPRLLEQIHIYRERYPEITQIDFEDDVFCLSKPWVKDFSKAYADEVGLPFTFLARVESFNEEIMTDLASAGATKVKIGLESGNEWIRHEVMNRKMNNNRIIRAFDLCRSLGVRTQAFVMVGVPHETREHVQDTFDLMERIQPDEVSPAIFFPFPGTKLYDECVEKGLWDGEYVGDCYEKCTLTHPNMTKEEIKYYFHRLTDVVVQNDVKRNPRGAFDLLANFENANVSPQWSPDIKVSYLGNSYFGSFGIHAPAPSEIRYDIPPPNGHDWTLNVDFGVHSTHYDFPCRAVRFEIDFEDSGGARRNLMTRELSPYYEDGHKGWHSAKVEIPRTGESGKLVLKTADTQPKDDVNHPLACWGRPFIE